MSLKHHPGNTTTCPDNVNRCSICGITYDKYYITDAGYLCQACREQYLKTNAFLGLPEYYKSKKLDNFNIIDNNYKDVKNKVCQFLDNEFGLFLSGSVGTGKTHLASGIYQRLREYGYQPVFVAFPDILLEIRETFNNRENISEQDIISKYSDCDYLFLDDLGAEKISEWTIETLYLIIDKRYRTEKWKIFITTNLSLQKLSDLTSDRICSRIAEMCKLVNISGFRDYRLGK